MPGSARNTLTNLYKILPEPFQDYIRKNSLANYAYKTSIVLDYGKQPIKDSINYIINSEETTNFSYRLTELNKKQLAGFVSDIVDIPIEEAEEYINEIENDEKLREHIRNNASKSDFQDPKFGRRIGWYALVRASEPQLVVESGVKDGLGTCVIASALTKNDTGKVIGIDNTQSSGILFSKPYSEFGEISINNSVEKLEEFEEKIDIFIHDSKHTKAHIQNELEAIESNINSASLLISDASHHSDVFYNYSKENDRKYLFFKEEVDSHWYPGGGIGVSFKDNL